MLRHDGYVPNSLREYILQPIPKPGKDPPVLITIGQLLLLRLLAKCLSYT